MFTFGCVWLMVLLMIGNMYMMTSKIWEAQTDLYDGHYMKEKELLAVNSEVNGLRASTLNLLLRHPARSID